MKKTPVGPLNRTHFLIVHGQDAKRWCERYGIEPCEYECELCGEKLVATVPFAFGQFRGLIAPTCICGNKNTPYCFVRDPKYGDLLGDDFCFGDLFTGDY